METLFDKMGGRKFVLTMIILVAGGLVEAFGKNGLSANFVALLLGASTVFGVANAAVTLKGMSVTGEDSSAPVGASTGDEANVKVDFLNTHVENVTSELLQQSQDITQMRSELETQAKSLALATQLIKASMKVNV